MEPDRSHPPTDSPVVYQAEEVRFVPLVTRAFEAFVVVFWAMAFCLAWLSPGWLDYGPCLVLAGMLTCCMFIAVRTYIKSTRPFRLISAPDGIEYQYETWYLRVLWANIERTGPAPVGRSLVDSFILREPACWATNSSRRLPGA